MRVKRVMISVMAAAMLATLPAKQAAAAVEPYIGEIMWVGFTFCPRGWAQADGQLLSISSNSALFSLYGTTYGGDGRTTFALPDLRGRVSVHVGQATGLSNYLLGQRSGSEQVMLTEQQIAGHSHLINASQGATDNDPSGSIPGGPGRTRIYDAPGTASTTMAANTVANNIGGQTHENRPPYLALRACVALQGIFPPRN